MTSSTWMKDEQQVATPAASAPADIAATPKRRLSCTACSHPHQPSPPSSSRRSSHPKTLTLTPPSISNSSHDSLITHKSNHHNNAFHHASNQHHHLDLTNLAPTVASSSNSSLPSSGFKLNFNTAHSQPPKIKCHIDHLHQDLELDVKLDGNDDKNNEVSSNNNDSSSRFTLKCYNPNDPNRNLKLKVELVKTSAKGFGLKIMQHTPHPPSLTDSNNEASLASKKEKSKVAKSEGDSRRNSIRSESSRSVPRSRDISELDEVRISSGRVSRAGDDGEDHCKCTTPCGALNCKAIDIPKEPEVKK